jgi:DNA replication and repair protein RecF
LEAAAWTATGASFRGVPDSALVRAGSETAIVRAQVTDGARTQLLEAEIRASGRNRVRLNRHPLARARDRRELMRVTVFAPDDLQLVKGGPAERRGYLDGLLNAVAPRYESVISDYDRVLRQRNALLKQHRERDPDVESTLRVFDAQLARAGAELGRGRFRMLDRLTPLVTGAYAELAGHTRVIDAAYEAEWADAGVFAAAGDSAPPLEAALLDALMSRRRAETERRVTLAGPHRDEWRLRVGGLEARTHASQGEQRTLALALRLAAQRTVAAAIDDEPVLLHDDVFSEHDDERGNALVARLTGAQTLVPTAGSLPAAVEPATRLRIADGRVEAQTELARSAEEEQP